MDHKKSTQKPLRSKGAAAKQSQCNARPHIAATLPEITLVWMERVAGWREGSQPAPHILSRKAVRWMW